MDVHFNLNLTFVVAAAAPEGGTGHWPVSSGDSPLETGRAPEIYRPAVPRAKLLSVPLGQWPNGTGKLPVLPRPIWAFSVNRLACFLAGFLVMVVSAWADAPALKVAAVVEPFPMPAVRLLDGPFRDAMTRDGRYLLSLDSDRLLLNFRLNAGLPSSARPYGGWEATNCELRGHVVGHYLSACSLMYASTGDARFK